MSMYGAWPKVGGKEQKARTRTSFVGDKGLTVQADRDAADINKIVARLEKGAMIDRMAAKQPFYGDVSDLGDLSECLVKVNKANELFMTYDASIRERFENDPVKMVEFFEDPANIDEAVKLGLVAVAPLVPAAPAPGTPV